jgi:hypothetical protein
MKGKLYKLDKATGKMVEIGPADITLPKLNPQSVELPTGPISGIIEPIVIGPIPIDKEKLLNAVDTYAESLERRRCIAIQRITDKLRSND